MIEMIKTQPMMKLFHTHDEKMVNDEEWLNEN